MTEFKFFGCTFPWILIVKLPVAYLELLKVLSFPSALCLPPLLLLFLLKLPGQSQVSRWMSSKHPNQTERQVRSFKKPKFFCANSYKDFMLIHCWVFMHYTCEDNLQNLSCNSNKQFQKKSSYAFAYLIISTYLLQMLSHIPGGAQNAPAGRCCWNSSKNTLDTHNVSYLEIPIIQLQVSLAIHLNEPSCQILANSPDLPLLVDASVEVPTSGPAP